MNLVALKPVPNSVGMIMAGQAFTTNDAHAQELIRSGHAREDDGTALAWDGIQWPGATVVILASGPSLTEQQCADVSEWRTETNTSPRRVIAVNTTFRRAPWADVLYACDAPWWRATDKESGFKNNFEEAAARFTGALWTQDKEAAREFGINHVESARLPGLGKRPGVIHQGGNGGYQSINLAAQAGARKIVLLGFDMKGTHWHGPYTNGLPNTAPHLFTIWLKNFEGLAADLALGGIEVLNATPGSALTAFKTSPLEDALSWT